MEMEFAERRGQKKRKREECWNRVGKRARVLVKGNVKRKLEVRGRGRDDGCESVEVGRGSGVEEALCVYIFVGRRRGLG